MRWLILLIYSLGYSADYNATVVNVHDGDTITARVELGFDVSVTHQFRLKDVYAPELKSEKGELCRKKLEELMGSNILIRTITTKSGNEIKSFDRYIILCYNANGNINTAMANWLSVNKLTGGNGL